MNIALIGGTGFVGSRILPELLQRGHAVSALARHPNKYTANARLRVVKTDVLDAAQVAEGVAGHNAIISAFNPGWQEAQIHDLFLQGTAAIVAGARAAGVTRLLIVGGVGSLFTADGRQLVDDPAFPAEYRDGALASREALNRLHHEHDLEWTFLSPPAWLEPGQRHGTYRVGCEQILLNGDDFAGISLEDLAVAVVDEIERPRHIRRRFTVAH